MSNEDINIHQEDKLSEQEILRRQKLKDLQDAGKDPFDVYKVERTHSSAQIVKGFEDKDRYQILNELKRVKFKNVWFSFVRYY